MRPDEDLAAAIAIPHSGHCDSGSAGAGLGRGDAASPFAKRTLSIRLAGRQAPILGGFERARPPAVPYPV